MAILDCPVSTVSYAVFTKFVYIGAYITDPQLRGRGIGSTLWNSLINKLGSEHNYYIKSSNNNAH